MSVLGEFKPSKKLLCTCPPKYTLNPYIGCSIGCVYCYGRHYSDFHKKSKKYRAESEKSAGKEFAIPRNDLIERLKKDIKKKPKRLVYLSSIVDPYTHEEEKYGITREALKILVENDFPIHVQTKNPTLMLRDLDVLRESSRCMVSVTITTLYEKKSRKIEPFAPSPAERIEALEELSKEFITTAWIDPIIPYFNDGEKGLDELLKRVKDAGTKMITSGVLRIVRRYEKKIEEALPEIKEDLMKLYFTNPDTRYFYYYAPFEYRYKITKMIRKLADKHGLGFGSCRTCSEFNTRVCDGSEYIMSSKFKKK